MHQIHLTCIRRLLRRAHHRPWARAIHQVMDTLPDIGLKKYSSDLGTEERRVLSFEAPIKCKLAGSDVVNCSKADSSLEMLKPSASAIHHTTPDTHWPQMDR